jgi:hypothetical protein
MIGRGKSERWMEEMKEIPEIHLTATEVEEVPQLFFSKYKPLLLSTRTLRTFNESYLT